jgi:predicted secreted acid phosphatase
MKKHIIALLAISTLALASCGTQKEAVADVPPPPPPVNPALEWRKSSEFEYINMQTFKFAANQLQMRLGNMKQAPVVFIDVPFLLLDQDVFSNYLDNVELEDGLRLDEVEGFSKYRYNPVAIDFLRMCQDAGVQVYLMADEREILGTIEDLATKNLIALPSMFDGRTRYGQYGRNITMIEMAESNRIALILTTSLGEVSSLTGMGRAINENMEELYRVHGDKLIVFPNPAFN